MARRSPQVSGHGQKLTRKSEAAIGALLASSSISEAARTCGVNERTLRNWMTRPDFREAYDRARRQVLDQVLAHLQASAGQALDTLLAVCRDQDARPAARVAAARLAGVLDLQSLDLEVGPERSALDTVTERQAKEPPALAQTLDLERISERISEPADDDGNPWCGIWDRVFGTAAEEAIWLRRLCAAR
jgi:DNA-binding transcriptional MerR regulator